MTVHGPNGFLREFKGSPGSADIRVAARQAGRSEQWLLTLRNESDSTVQLTVTDMHGKHGRRRTH
jgi:phospholipase C